MRGKIDLGGSSYIKSMEEKSSDYALNLRKAEGVRKENDGQPTRLEAEYLYKAANKCGEIMSLNLSQREVHTRWASRRAACEARIREITEALAPHVDRMPSDEPSHTPASKPDLPQQKDTDSNGKPVSAPEGEFTTKNANADVSAETIRSWYQDPENARSFEELVGMEDLKSRLLAEAASVGWDLIDKDLKISTVQSYFLYGPPGTGKTTFINAFAKEMQKQGFRYLQLTGSQIHNPLVGVAEKIVTAAFNEAIDAAPCVIFIDEVEGVCANRSNSNTASHEKRLTNAFLEARNKMKNCGKRIIFFGATNHPTDVDPAMLDSVKLLYIPLPDEASRCSYFSYMLDQIPPEEGFSYEEMAALTEGCSYRELDMLSDTIKVAVKQQLIEDYKVENEGDMDQKQTDQAAHEALSAREFRLSRELFTAKLREYPPKDKTAVLEELKAFEGSLSGLG